MVGAGSACRLLFNPGSDNSPHHYFAHKDNLGEQPLKLEALRKTYPDGTEAVKGINLEVKEGKFIVLLGPSGCGKTTTLRMIAGLEEPTGGRIIVGDEDITQLKASERDVGFVFQFYALYPHMTIRDNIGFPLDNIGLPRTKRDQRVDEVATRLGIHPFLERHPGELSDGDQQRASLARAMVRNPAIYLMDEPLGQLDASIRLDLREAIRRQQLETHVTTLYVTHDQEEALSLADAVVVMNDGRIEQTGSPEEVYNRPESLFVANFVGSPGMNLFPGRINRRNGEASFHTENTMIPVDTAAHSGEVRLGIRPEHVHLDPAGSLRGRVMVNEYFGDHVIVHLDSDSGTILTRSRTSLEVGSVVGLNLDTNHILMFDPSTGKSVL
jgi:multiple sugar transport system ATP-binding protein